MQSNIIKTEYEVEILSDNSNTYVSGNFYPASNLIDDYLALYGFNGWAPVPVLGCDVPVAIGHICRLWGIKAFLHTYTTTKKTQSIDDL